MLKDSKGFEELEKITGIKKEKLMRDFRSEKYEFEEKKLSYKELKEKQKEEQEKIKEDHQ